MEAFADWERGSHLQVVPVGWLVAVAGHMQAVYCLWFAEHVTASMVVLARAEVD